MLDKTDNVSSIETNYINNTSRSKHDMNDISSDHILGDKIKSNDMYVTRDPSYQVASDKVNVETITFTNNSNSNNNRYHSNNDSLIQHNSKTVDVNSKTNSFTFCNHGLHVASINIQHLVPKLDELKFHLTSKNSPDIVGIYETFLNNDITDECINISNFNIERKDRVGKKGGGVLVYISSKVPYKRRHDLETIYIESICIEITYSNIRPFILSFTYRPPHSNQEWIDTFESFIDKVDLLNCEMFLLGDYNIRYHSDFDYKFNNSKWADMILKFGLHQLVTVPTRVCKTVSTIIDHLYTNSPDSLSEVFVPNLSMSDHFPVCFTYKLHECKTSKTHTHNAMRYRSFKRFDLIKFQHDLSMCNFGIIETISNPDLSLQLFYDILNNTLNRHAPIKEKRIKRACQPPWFDDEVKEAIYKRNKLKQEKRFHEYSILRNQISSMIKKKKRNFYNDAIKNNNSPSYLWKTLKSVTNKDIKPRDVIPKTLTYNNKILEDKCDILDALNDHFCNISNIVKKTAFVKTHFQDLKSFLDRSLNENTFSLQHITVFEVDNMLKTLKTNKATGLDGIGANILKYCGDYIVPTIAFIINQCIDQSIFPDILKEACIIPIFKGGDKADPNNYRPISILPTISKLFERHVAKQLQQYFDKTNIIHDKQSGFRQKHSCQTALIDLIDTWLKDVDSGKYVGTIFLDLRKAFDLVDHEILLHKLFLYHFTPKTVDFFRSYLTNRSQVIRDGITFSNKLIVTSGVPQGSILGPLLFVLYINDMSYATKQCNSSLDLYADDSTVHKSDHELSVVQNNLQMSLNVINKWCVNNNMMLNPLKTKCMVIATASKHRMLMNNSINLKLSLDGVEIEIVKQQKVLGITIHDTLSWKPHITNVCSSINRKIILLKRLIYYLNDDMKKLYYQAYILPIFDYCSVVWGQHITSSSRLYKLHVRVMRIIFNTSTDHAIVMQKNNNWLNCCDRIKYHTGVMVYKTKNHHLPAYMNDLLTFSSNNVYGLRSTARNDLTLPKPRTNYLKSTFQYCSSLTWNSIPENIRSSITLNSFRKAYKGYLLN